MEQGAVPYRNRRYITAYGLMYTDRLAYIPSPIAAAVLIDGYEVEVQRTYSERRSP